VLHNDFAEAKERVAIRVTLSVTLTTPVAVWRRDLAQLTSRASSPPDTTFDSSFREREGILDARIHSFPDIQSGYARVRHRPPAESGLDAVPFCLSLSYNNIDWQQHVIDFAAGRSHSRENRRFRDYTSKWGLA